MRQQTRLRTILRNRSSRPRTNRELWRRAPTPGGGASPTFRSTKPKLGRRSRTTHEPEAGNCCIASRPNFISILSRSRTSSNAHQRPKVESTPIRCSWWRAPAKMGTATCHSARPMFSSGRLVVPVRHGPSTSYKAVRQRCESPPASLAKGRTSRLRHPRLHRRQLHAGHRLHRGGGRRARGEAFDDAAAARIEQMYR